MPEALAREPDKSVASTANTALLQVQRDVMRPDISLRKGQAMEIFDTRQQIDLNLGGAKLQIIKAPQGMNADYLLVDPGLYEASKGERGFKGIREGFMVFGRGHNDSRFELPQTVSHEHISIQLIKEQKSALGSDTLVIMDLGSTNGTTVKALKGTFDRR